MHINVLIAGELIRADSATLGIEASLETMTWMSIVRILESSMLLRHLVNMEQEIARSGFGSSEYK